MSMWSEVRDGTAVGPSVVVEVGDETVTVTALWSDEEGVGITVDMSPDVFLPADDAMALMEATRNLLAIAPPATERVG